MTVTPRTYVEEARREKLQALRERGVEPFAYRFERTHTARQAVAAHAPDAQTAVRIAGRVIAMRGHGKTTFAHVADPTGNVQVYFKKDDLGADGYDVVTLLDIGDFIGVAGHMFATKTGEVTVWAAAVELLAKALRPLPFGKADASGELHGELSDPEIRYRQRYADLAVHPDVREVFRTRAATITYMRRFLDGHGFVELETPVLQPVYGGALAQPFTTHYNALDATFYLRIATELYLKRCIVGGLERVYEIGKDFRNEGMDRLHNPEFTMLEFYAALLDYEDVLALVEEMLHGVVVDVCGSPVLERYGKQFDFTRPWRHGQYTELVREHAGIDLLGASDAKLRETLITQLVTARFAGSHHEASQEIRSMPRTKLIDEVFKVSVEPHLEQPTFVVDYPIEISPLAKPKRGEPRLAERFELYLNGGEIANAFSELNDPDDQRARFEAQGSARAAGDADAHQLDEDYLRAMEYGMPPTGGCGIGIDRLVMLLTDRPSIRDVILYPMLRPES